MCSIEWTGLNKSYAKVRLSYRDQCIKGKRTILLGGNGSGKSTLLKMMLGWVHHDGTMRVDGRLSYMPEVPAFPRDVDAATFLTVLEPADPAPWFERFGLSTRHHEPIHHYSKGMRGKLNAIQCLMKEADWYLFDEPENGLDDAGWRVLRTWLARTDRRWIVATHLPDRYKGLEAEVIRLDP